MTALALDRAPSFAARRPVILGFLSLAVLVSGAVGWGAFTTIAGAVIAAGKVEVESRDQVVEHSTAARWARSWYARATRSRPARC